MDDVLYLFRQVKRLFSRRLRWLEFPLDFNGRGG